MATQAKEKKLREYERKRDFATTPEPAGKEAKPSEYPIFVVQEHDATRHHYDFRLEIGGVLKSWAVPKGPSLDPSDKRMAVETEDHPMEYADFEGVIPEGEYGAGPVIIWDRGRYANISTKRKKVIDAGQAVKEGHLKVWLEGEKLKGGFALTRLPGKEKPTWLLVKMKDEEAEEKEDLLAKKPKSVVSGKRIEELGLRKRRKKE